MASSGKDAKSTSAQEAAARAPSPGGSDRKVADVEKETGSTTSSAKTAAKKRASSSKGKAAPKAEPTALMPSPGGSDVHAEAVQEELPTSRDAKPQSEKAPAKTGAQATLNGRFPPGTTVQLVKVAGAHVLRTSAGDEVVDEKVVDEDGRVQFKKGVESDGRYFVRGYVADGPLEIRIRGRAEADDNDVLAQAPVGYDEVRTRDGRVFGTRGTRIPGTPEHLAH